MSDKRIAKPATTPATPEQVPALWKPIQAVVELATGIASSESKDWYLSAGHVLQRIRGGHFTATLINEINAYRKKGRIKDDYFRTEQGQVCMQEVLDALDNDSPDEIRFNAMKAVLLVVASESKSSREDVLPQQLMRICRQLSSTEVLIVTSCSAVYRHNGWHEQMTHDLQKFIPLIVKRSGLEFDDLVYLYIDGLVGKRLIVKIPLPHVVAKTDPPPPITFKLTRLGERLCSFIEAYTP